MNCLWCDAKINIIVHWKNFFLPDKNKQICSTCVSQLAFIGGSICQKCGRKYEGGICKDCQQWSRQFKYDPLERNIALLKYNDFLKEVISLWKYRGDYVLVYLFKEHFRQLFFKRYNSIIKNALIVPIPLSEERLLERGFNQAEALAHLLISEHVKIDTILIRKHSEKQSKKTRFERIGSVNPFMAHKKIRKPVILIDDLYTTGTTLRHAAKVLRTKGCPAVFSFTLARS